jgi:hypothetical protein
MPYRERGRRQGRGDPVHETTTKHPATADHRHCRTPPADLVIPSHPHKEPLGQAKPSRQSLHYMLQEALAMRARQGRLQRHRPHADQAMPDRFQNRHHMPCPGPASDARRAASSRLPRRPGWAVRTTAGWAHDMGRRTSRLGRRGMVGSGPGVAAVARRTGPVGAQ